MHHQDASKESFSFDIPLNRGAIDLNRVRTAFLK
jgi:hypothetical protein